MTLPPEKREPAVVDGKVQYVSASSINRFFACNRSYWFRYVLGLPDPVGPSALKGVASHGRIEHYLKTGDDILSETERQGLHLIPRPDPFLLVEKKIDYQLKLGSIPLKGGIDCVAPAPVAQPAVITDWKFKGKIAGIAPPQLDSIETDEGRQMITYGEWFRLNVAGPLDMDVILRHAHFQFDGKVPPREYSVQVPLAVVAQKWQTLSEQVESQIVRVAAAKTHTEVTPNLGHCKKYYKPCPYLARCQEGQAAVPRPFTSLNLKGSTMGMLDMMKSLTAATTPPAAPVETLATAPSLVIDESTVPDAVLLAAKSEPTESQTAPKRGRPKGSKNKVKLTDAQVFVTNETASAEPAPSEVVVTETAEKWSPVPPPRQYPQPGLSNEYLETVARLKAQKEAPTVPSPILSSEEQREIAAKLAQLQDAILAPNPSDRAAAKEAADSAFASAKPGAISTLLTPDEQKTIAARLAGIPASDAAAYGYMVAPSTGALKLYFVGTPIGVIVKDLTEYAEAVQKEVLKEAGEDTFDVRLASHKDLSFGKWKAVVARFAELHPPEPGHYLVTRGDEMIEAIAFGLARVAGAGNVVR